MSPRKNSFLTVTDQFCGAGGSSIGAAKAGLEIRMAMNHWKLAVETHNTNFPNTDHDCCDISASDPRRYPSTDILITSPECTTHSPAGGNRRSTPQRDFFHSAIEDPAVARSRATMRDVPRFAEYHKYRRIIVENVVEVVRWPLFHHWLKEMEILGYRWKLVSLNSMFCWPTPQSRDRLYIVFWRKGDKAPDMNITPLAPCHRCEKVVLGEQSWKPAALGRAIAGQPIGKYRTQYNYTCPVCRIEVVPFYYAALNAIDFSIPAERIGDRARPLQPRTIERIMYGLEKYGRRQLLVRTIHGERVFCRVRDAESMPFGTQPGSGITGLFSPFTIETAYSQRDDAARSKGVDEPFGAQTSAQTAGLVAPFVVNMHGSNRARGLNDPLPTQVAECVHDWIVQGAPFLAALRGTDPRQRSSWASGPDEPIGTVSAGGVHHALIGPGFMPFVAANRANNVPRGADDSLPPVTTAHGGGQFLVQGAAQISMRDANAMRVAGLDEELRAQGCGPQQALLSRIPRGEGRGHARARPLDRPGRREPDLQTAPGGDHPVGGVRRTSRDLREVRSRQDDHDARDDAAHARARSRARGLIIAPLGVRQEFLARRCDARHAADVRPHTAEMWGQASTSRTTNRFARGRSTSTGSPRWDSTRRRSSAASAERRRSGSSWRSSPVMIARVRHPDRGHPVPLRGHGDAIAERLHRDRCLRGVPRDHGRRRGEDPLLQARLREGRSAHALSAQGSGVLVLGEHVGRVPSVAGGPRVRRGGLRAAAAHGALAHGARRPLSAGFERDGQAKLLGIPRSACRTRPR
jgi:DNA (cytosine-5)-methyltransferase 1